MNKKIIKNKKEQRLSKLIASELGLSFGGAQKIIRAKDVKVNNLRVGMDIVLKLGDEIEVYYSKSELEIIFENKDIVVVNKPRNIETVSELEDDLLRKLSEQMGISLFAVHRLDRNTQGLVIFAKNLESKKALDNAIKNRDIEKYYIAKVVGVPEIKEQNLIAFLKKDKDNSLVYVSDNKRVGYEEIRTNYKLLESEGDFSILEVSLITGKTHQIRAHLSHIGFPILGDEKYGNCLINKKMKRRQQCLCAYKIILHFKEGYLSYLDGKVFELDKSKIKI